MTLDEVMRELESKGDAQTKKTFLRHGATEPFFGVKVGELKPIAKRIKGQQQLAMQLYETGNSDAMYLAGLVADGSKMTKKQLEDWVKTAPWYMISQYTVPWVAAEHAEAIPLANKWIDSKKEQIAIAGWFTLASVVATVADSQLPIEMLADLLDRVAKSLKQSPDRVRYAMNNYVICVGTYVAPLASKALATAKKLGVVEVDMGDTSCKVPDAASYMVKARKGNPIAPKRKTTRC